MRCFLTTAGGASFTVTSAERAGDARASPTDIAARARARRPRDAVGRPRRRQDHVRARADPPSRRRRHDRGAEPDLHADADLRAAALSRSSMPISTGCRARPSLPSSASTTCPKDAVVLLEWPDRAAGFLPPDRLDIAFTLAPQLGADVPQRARHRLWRVRAARRAHRRGAQLPRRSRLRRRASAGACRATPRRASTSGSRSTSAATILMNAPRRPDGPPVRDGKPYSAIAHLAEDVDAVRRAWRPALRDRGLSAPAILHADLDHGPADHGGPRRRAHRRRRSAGADRGALRGRRRSCWRRCTRQQLPDVLPVAPQRRLPPAALRHGRASDRGRAAARLVSAAAAGAA